MQMSTKGLLFLMQREGVVLSSYKDSVGVWTIGVGHTAAAGPPTPTPGRTITLQQALELFRKDVAKYEAAVVRAVKVPVAQHEFDALVSFHYNTGGIARAKLTEELNRGNRKEAASGFLGWLVPREIEGRRRKEMNLFASGDYGDLSTVPVYDKHPGKPRSVPTQGLLGEQPKQTVPNHPFPASPDKAGNNLWVGIIILLIMAAAAVFGISLE